MKNNILIGTIVSMVITLILAEMFSIYHFGSIPTLLTTLYLMSIFLIFEYLSIAIIYVIRKKIKKEKLDIRMIIGLILLFIAIFLVLLFLIIIDIDYLHWYMYSSPFYLNVIVRSIEFLFPAIVLIIISILMIKNKK